MHGVVIQTDRRLDNMVRHLGYASIRKDTPSFPKEVVKTDTDLIREMADKLGQTEVIPDPSLKTLERNHLEFARAVARSFSSTGPVYAATIPPASDMVSRTAGTYEFGRGIIKIDVSQLQNAADTISVMAHELGHHVAYLQTGSQILAADLTKAHEHATEYVAGRIARNIAQGRYDAYINDILW